MPTEGGKLAVWKSNFEAENATIFERQSDISVDAGGSFTLDVEIGDFYMVSTVMTATKGQSKTPVPVCPPLKYAAVWFGCRGVTQNTH